MIEVFTTNVQEPATAKTLVDLLKAHFPESKINFDLDDCDNILRVEGKNFSADGVMLLLKQTGFQCAILE